MAPTREAVVEALGNVIDPELRKPVTELDMVRDVAIREGEVTVRIALPQTIDDELAYFMSEWRQSHRYDPRKS